MTTMLATKKNWAAETEPHAALDEALFRAVLASDPAAVADVLAAGSNPNALIHGQTPLHVACRVHGQGAMRGLRRSPATMRVIELLLEAGSDPRIRGSLGFLPAAWAEGDVPACLRQRMAELTAAQTWPEMNPDGVYDDGEVTLAWRPTRRWNFIPSSSVRARGASKENAL